MLAQAPFQQVERCVNGRFCWGEIIYKQSSSNVHQTCTLFAWTF
jgi:hypothetical protein